MKNLFDPKKSTKDWSKVGETEKSIPEPTRKDVASDTAAITSGIPKELRNPYYDVLNNLPLKLDPTKPNPSLTALFNACGANRDYCKPVAASLAARLSLQQMEEISKEFYKLECGTNVPFRGNSLAKEFARVHLKTLLDNKYNDFIKDAVDAVKNPKRIVEGKEEAFNGTMKPVNVIKVNLSFDDVKKLIAPMYDVINNIMSKQDEKTKMMAFAKIFDFHLLSTVIQESKNAQALDSNSEDKANLLRIRFRLDDKVVAQLYKEYLKVDVQQKLAKSAGPENATNVKEEDAALRPPRP